MHVDGLDTFHVPEDGISLLLGESVLSAAFQPFHVDEQTFLVLIQTFLPASLLASLTVPLVGIRVAGGRRAAG